MLKIMISGLLLVYLMSGLIGCAPETEYLKDSERIKPSNESGYVKISEAYLKEILDELAVCGLIQDSETIKPMRAVNR